MRNFLLLILIGFAHNVEAQDIYKWKDAEGKIHFGDRSKAPAVSKKIEIKLKEVTQVVATTPPTPQTTTTPKATLEQAVNGIAPDRVNPKCRSIVDEIEKVAPGTPWRAQAREFDQLCSGITWECIEYKRTPEKNQCGWIKRKGNDIVSKSVFH